ncbi:hypothetical protein [Chitinophaga sp. Cy-1792]|uniref:hypothetical protein n=1 Tax=Chitinophaga sp. Cy-1792 TaxID=2608339 RepID=UPI0014202D92|nr:hypothetical protein [Chitinophaga sp. Cy-1792]NIG55063.1 hypothetical protein [Chitinophaga sp. Cy-1792]
MNMVFSVGAYQKAPGCIVGHIPMMGYYEVKEEPIDDFAIPGSYIATPGEFRIMKEAMNLCPIHQFGLIRHHLHIFDQISDAWSGTGISGYDDERTIMMFEPTIILPVITKLIAAKDYILSSLAEAGKTASLEYIEDCEEILFLDEFKTLLESAIAQNAMVYPALR